MTITCALRRLLVLASAVLAMTAPAPVQAEECCPGHALHCPGYTHCQPKPPHLKFKKVCSKPVCDPCTLESWGYHPTCWAPFPGPLNYSHCPVPPPSAFFPAHTGHMPVVPAEEAVMPRGLAPSLR